MSGHMTQDPQPVEENPQWVRAMFCALHGHQWMPEPSTSGRTVMGLRVVATCPQCGLIRHVPDH